MQVVVKKVDSQNVGDAGKCDGVFAADSELVLSFQNGVIIYSVRSVPPYQKRYPKEEVDFRSYIGNQDKAMYIAYVDGAIAGEIRVRTNWNNFGYVEDLVVDAGFRRRGVGRALLQNAVEWGVGRGLPGLMLETQNNNVAACLLYQSCGFEIGGFDRQLYKGLNPKSEEIALFWYLIFRG